jgi:hypothetical protein
VVQEVSVLRQANKNMQEKCALVPVDNELLQVSDSEQLHKIIFIIY